MSFECCKYCFPPKRHSGCHSSCEAYLTQKAQHEARKASYDDKRNQAREIADYEIKRTYGIRKSQRTKRSYSNRKG